MNGTTDMTSIIIQQIKEIEARDESQIMAELAGETIREMVYTVDGQDRKTGKHVEKYKLSWAGTKEAARGRGNIVVDNEPFVTENEDSFRIVVKVIDLTRNMSIFGGCHQPKKMKVYDRDPVTHRRLEVFHYETDDYAFQKGLSKAQRNAFQTILPADHIARCIDRFLKAAQRPVLKGKEPLKALELARQSQAELKAKNGWASITKEQVPDYPSLEKIFWDITKKQPKDMYSQLGVNSRSDLAITAWDAFLQLREALSPV